MRTRLPLLAAALAAAAGPAAAASGEYGFFSLRNTDFVVLLAFIVFVAILLWFRVFPRVGQMLDNRAETIRGELAEARALREEAQALLASFDGKRREMTEQAARIVAEAREESARAARQAEQDAARAVERRIASAEEQIAAAETRALRQVKDRAAALAVAAAQEVLASQMSPEASARLIDQSIETVGRRLH